MKQHRIDVHAHYITEKYRAALQAAGHGRPSGMQGIPAWSMDLAIATMDRLDIGSALLSVSAPGLHFGDDTAARELARHVNDAGAEAVRRYPARFGLFASLPCPMSMDLSRKPAMPLMNSRRTAWCSRPITMVSILATAGSIRYSRS